MLLPLPFMKVESSWMRPVAYRPPQGMSEDDFFAMMAAAQVLDFTLPFSVQTPQWANYEPLTVRNHKRVGGQAFGMGRNNAICKASFHLATHMDGEKHFWSSGTRTIGQVPLEPLDRPRRHRRHLGHGLRSGCIYAGDAGKRGRRTAKGTFC